MKKLGLAAIAILFAAATFAQTTTTPVTTTPTPRTPAEKAQMKDLRQDIRTLDKDKAEAKTEINKGDFADAKTDITNAQTVRTDIKADATTLKSEGIATPVKTADKQVKAIDEKAVKTTITDIHADKVSEQADVKAGNIKAAQAEQADIKADRKALKADIKQARRDGIKHPVRRAK